MIGDGRTRNRTNRAGQFARDKLCRCFMPKSGQTSLRRLLGISFISVQMAWAQTPLVPAETDARIQAERYQQALDAGANYSWSDSVPDADARESGPRIKVKRIELDGLPSKQLSGVDPARAEALAEQLRKEFTAEPKRGEHGFTDDELDQIGHWLQRRMQSPERADIVVSELEALLNKQRFERGLSYAQLQTIASQITALYRNEGLFLARAYVPEQTVEEGVVRIEVLAGRLSEVAVSETEHYDPYWIGRAFKDQTGELVKKEQVEESFYLLNDRPGLSVYGYFEAAEGVGETRLNVVPTQEKLWRLSVRADNHGSRFTGDRRVYALIDRYNLAGVGDALRLGLLHSFSPSNADLATLEYRFPIKGIRSEIRFASEYNDFQVDDDGDLALKALQIEGINRSNTLTFQHHFKRSRLFNFNTEWALSDRETDISATSVLPSEGDHARAIESRWNINGIDEDSRQMTVASFAVQYGDRVGEAETDIDGHYWKFDGSLSWLKIFNAPWYDGENRWVVNGRWQYSEQVLPSFEQLSLGGPQASKGFAAGDVSVDQGVVLSAEWYFALPDAFNPELGDKRLNDVLQLAWFIDGAYGEQYASVAGTDDDWAHLSSWGLLMRWQWGRHFSSQISIADPISSSTSSEGLLDSTRSIRSFVDVTLTLD